MKPVYERPTMNVENFAANEFIAACGDNNVVYKFKCDAGAYVDKLGRTKSVSGKVYFDNNHNGILDKTDKYYMSYHACGAEHEASTTDDFYDGIYVPGFNRQGIETMPVKIWKGPRGNNVHCTAELDMNQWETAKS